MNNFRLFLGVASCSLLAIGSVAACGGDDTSIAADSGARDATSSETGPVLDAGPDADNADGTLGDGDLPDGTLPDGALPDGRLPDGNSPDSADAGDGDSANVDSGPPLTAPDFLGQVAAQVCARIAACCLQIDAGAINNNKCTTELTPFGWQGSNGDIGALLAAADGGADASSVLANVTVDGPGAQSCINAIKALPCATGVSQDTTSIQICYFDAIHGKLLTGQTCTQSVECQQPAYCNYAVDGGSSGTCQPLVAQGGNCASVAGAGNRRALNANEACSRRGTGIPSLFCDNVAGDFTLKPLDQWLCQPTKSNGSSCAFNQPCTSLICDDVSSLCSDTRQLADPGECQFYR